MNYYNKGYFGFILKENYFLWLRLRVFKFIELI